MKRIIKWLAATLLLALALTTALLVNVWYFKPVAIDAFYVRMFAKFALERPEMLSGLRVLPAWAARADFYSAKLDDASPDQDARDAAAVADNLATLRRYDRNALDREGRLSYDTLEYFLRSQEEGDAWRLAGFPVTQLNGIHTQLPNLMVQLHQVNTASEARDYVARLNAFPRKFDETLANMALREGKGFVPPRFAVDKALALIGFDGIDPRLQRRVGLPAMALMLHRLQVLKYGLGECLRIDFGGNSSRKFLSVFTG